jgi:hypothetical protein
MDLDTRAQVAKATLNLLTIVVGLFLLGVLVLVLCAGLGINPFKETTTSFLIAAFIGLIGVAIVLVLLNVATNISLIADARIAGLEVAPRRELQRKWAAAFFVAAVAVVAIVFGGTYLSKERYMGVVHAQADEVLKENESLLDEVSRLLASGKFEDYKRISEIRSFLESQRSGLPQLTLIYQGKFTGKPAFYGISGYFRADEVNRIYYPQYFACTANRDCDYLTKFFAGEKVDILQKYTFRSDQFYIYIPYTGKETRFVLLFERSNSYGKLGS